MRVQGEHGFLRGTLRGWRASAASQGLGSEPPFRLIARADGRLTLEDPATGERVDLESFGPTNAASSRACWHRASAADGALTTTGDTP